MQSPWECLPSACSIPEICQLQLHCKGSVLSTLFIHQQSYPYWTQGAAQSELGSRHCQDLWVPYRSSRAVMKSAKLWN